MAKLDFFNKLCIKMDMLKHLTLICITVNYERQVGKELQYRSSSGALRCKLKCVHAMYSMCVYSGPVRSILKP